MATTMITMKMGVDKPQTVYFYPPILNVKEIQLIEVWASLHSYLSFCDAIDSSYSLINFDNFENLIQSKLIGLFLRGEPNISFPINKSVVSNLTLSFKETYLTTPTINDVAIINLKIIHE